MADGNTVRGRSRPGTLAALGALAAAGLVLAACGSSSTPSGAPAPTSRTSVATVRVATTAYGRILESPSGQVLYALTADAPTRAACTGTCLTVWPALTLPGAPVAGAGVSQSLLGTYATATGSHQLTYAGHQLYLYAGDASPGDTAGQGIPFPPGATTPAGHWYVVSASGTLVTTAPPASTTTSTTYGYGS